MVSVPGSNALASVAPRVLAEGGAARDRLKTSVEFELEIEREYHVQATKVEKVVAT